VDVSTFRMPGAAAPGALEVIEVPGVKPYQKAEVFCVLNATDLDKDQKE
jgi:hypothetical protein